MNKKIQKGLRLIKKIDLFTKPVQLMIRKEEGHKTLIGALLTLILIIITSIILITDVVAIFNGKDPIIISYQNQQQNPDLFSLRPNNFTMQIGLQDSKYNSYYDESIWVMKMKSNYKYYDKEYQQQIFSNNPQFGEVDIPTIKCDQQGAIKQIELIEDFKFVDQSKSLCIDWDSLNEIQLQGQFTSINYQFITIDFYICSNSTKRADGPECQPKDTIIKALSQNQLSLQTSSVITDQLNANNPFTFKIDDYTTTLSSNIMKSVTIWMQTLTTYSDNAFILKDYKTHKGLAVIQKNEVFNLDDSDQFLHITIRLNVIELITKRTYQKLQQALATTGGLWNVLFTVTMLLQMPFSELSYKLEIINSLFNFEGQQLVEKQKKSNMIDQSLFTQSLQNAENNMNSHFKQNFLKRRLKSMVIKTDKLIKIENTEEKQRLSNQISESIKQFFQIVSRKLQISFLEYITYFRITKKRSKLKQYTYSVKKLEKQMDILYIIKKLHEIDKLKMIFLNSAQIKVFDYLPMPTILEDPYSQLQEQQCFSILQSHKSSFQRAIDAQQAFKQIVNNQEDNINKQLIQFIDQNTIELLKLQFTEEKQTERQLETDPDYKQLNSIEIEAGLKENNSPG